MPGACSIVLCSLCPKFGSWSVTCAEEAPLKWISDWPFCVNLRPKKAMSEEQRGRYCCRMFYFMSRPLLKYALCIE